MNKRFLVTAMLLTFSVLASLAQQSLRKRVTPPEKPRLKSAITVIDLRNVTEAKKPPKREGSPTIALRMMSGAKPAVAPLAQVQMTEALKGVGIDVTPSNLYLRLTSTQSYVPGKGFLWFEYPTYVYPGEVKFESSYYGVSRTSSNGAMVTLKEQGTFVLDFLVEFMYAPAGTVFQCAILRGENAIQIQNVVSEAGPQHILVVMNQDAFFQGLDDVSKSIGLHCSREVEREMTIDWLLYLVDITKL
jgi:hypothetical protein